MAGKALRRRLLAQIADRGGPDYVRDYIASGKTILDLANELGCSRTYLSRHLHEQPEYSAVIVEARKDAADVLAEQALQIADQLATETDPVTRERIAVAKERIDIRKWLATVNNPERYRQDRAGPQVQINIGELHLDALKKFRAGDTARVVGGDE